MPFVSRIVEEDVHQKLDADYVRHSLADVGEDIAIIYVCVNDDWRKDDTWKKKGTKFYRIVLPYEEVKKMPGDQVRALMLQLARERLGLTEKKPAPAKAAAMRSAVRQHPGLPQKQPAAAQA